MIFSAVRSSIPLRFIPSVYLHTSLENTSPSVQASLAGWRPMHSAVRNETPRFRFASSRSRQSPHALRRAQFDSASRFISLAGWRPMKTQKNTGKNASILP